MEKVHEGKTTPTVVCEECEKKVSKARYEDHYRRVHIGVKHQCPTCDFQASCRRELRIHDRYKHMGIIQKCDICDLELETKNGYRRHLKEKHSSGEGRKCTLCEFITSKKYPAGEMVRHMKMKHKKSYGQKS